MVTFYGFSKSVRSYHSDRSLEDYDGGAGFISGLTSININNNYTAEYSNWNCAEVSFIIEN